MLKPFTGYISLAVAGAALGLFFAGFSAPVPTPAEIAANKVASARAELVNTCRMTRRVLESKIAANKSAIYYGRVKSAADLYSFSQFDSDVLGMCANAGL